MSAGISWKAAQKETLLPHHSTRNVIDTNIGIPFRLKSTATLTFFVLTCVWVSAYIFSLQGGDLLFINENLGIMGTEILVSVFSLTAITMMLYMRRLRTKTRRNMLFVTLALLVFLYVYDHGERFEKHGFYNFLVLLLIFIPLNITISLLYVLFVTVPNFVTILLFTAVIILCGATAILRHYMDIFGNGTFDRMRDIPGECTWQGNNYPLVDLLPPGTQNFWAGGMHCRPEPMHISAGFDDAGILHVNCTSGSIFVDILPQTRQWPLADKSKWQVFNHRVLDRMVRKRYDGPMRVDSEVQSVVVRCGSSSKVVTRVSPPISLLPKYIPPADSDTRANDLHQQPSPEHRGEMGLLPTRRPNVMFIFIDATSHRQFYRRLKKTATALATLHQPGKTALTELYRYHSLGVSTDNSTKAMYLGEIFPKRSNPLPIWAYYRDRGYVTARVETSCEDWTRTYAAKYYKSLSYSVGERGLDYELSAPFCMPEFYPATGNSFGNFKGPFSISARCLYGRHVHEYGFDYIDQLRKELRSGSGRNSSRPYMLMLNLMEGHEGTGEVLRTLDNRLSRFLVDLRDNGELEDTALFLLSDHGLHMGLNFAFLNSGQIEHKNPFYAMVLPQWLRSHVDSQTEQGLLVNEQRLTTPFETHYTLKTLADWPFYNPDDFKKSLFTPVKAGRSCADANIGANFCMCK
ncbi:hypothetical protein EV178_003842 [Coemansia sp. RSA 1646]|nr:hypothetical protein EV178_003842 [Coemansia sp. RSA 1646]KAJ2088568.1 hypothetical protein IW138_004158 [Coemansia sp. RSA 986]